MSENELDLDQIEALCNAVRYDKRPIKRQSAAFDVVAHVPAMLARIRELDAECDKVGRVLLDRGCHALIKELVLVYGLLTRVLAWRGLDGDGIDEPLRTEIEEAL